MMKFFWKVLVASLFSSIIFWWLIFATVQQPTEEWFWSVKIVTDTWGIKLAWTDKDQDTNIIDAIKWFINWTLWILWLVAVIMLLWWWFVMLTAVGNERFWSWFTIVKNALLWLVIIWFAWFIASIIFWITNLLAQDSEWKSAGTTSIVMPYMQEY